MFYILNFDNHTFISCANASVAEANIQHLLSNGTPADSLEIINGFVDQSRFQVQDFRTFCSVRNLVDENSVHAVPMTFLPDRITQNLSPDTSVHDGFKEITKSQADSILDFMTLRENKPRPRLSDSGFDFLTASGKYILRDGEKYVGFDYSVDYEGFVEDFDNLEECKAWLNNEFEISELEQWRFYNRKQFEQKPALELLIQKAKQKSINNPDSKTNRMTLRDFLSPFDFRYVVYHNDNEHENAYRKQLIADGVLEEKDFNAPLIGLIDEQGANYGNIQGDRFTIDQELAQKIIDRMNIYIEDGVISEFIDAIESRDLNSTNLSLENMVLICKELNIDNVSYDLAEMIISPNKIIVPELDQNYARNYDSSASTAEKNYAR